MLFVISLNWYKTKLTCGEGEKGGWVGQPSRLGWEAVGETSNEVSYGADLVEFALGLVILVGGGWELDCRSVSFKLTCLDITVRGHS